jgi:N-acetylated-alpha-linked acidic dipeptidase
VSDRINSLDAAASSLGQRLNEIDATRLSHDQRAAINHELLTMERAWLLNEGLPERPWFRSLYASSDPDSGYAAWMLPGLRWAIEQNDPKAIERWLAVYATALDGLLSRLAAIESNLNSTVAESP